MGIFRRVHDIISANLNDLIERFEDPERMLRQAVGEMESAVLQTMRGAASVIAQERLLGRRLAEQQRSAELCRQSAEQAVRAQNESAARDALLRKREHERIAAALSDERDVVAASAERLRRQVDALQARLAEARRKQTEWTARKAAADARRRCVDLSGGVLGESAFGRFDRMVHRIELAEAEAEAMDALHRGTAGGGMRSHDEALEAELAELKAQTAVG